MTKVKLTGADTHRATQRGYAIPEGATAGTLVEAGELVPAKVAVSDEWMERISGKEAELDRALEQALDPKPKDVNIEELKGQALTAHAASLDIDRGKLNDDDLRSAVRAKRADTA